MDIISFEVNNLEVFALSLTYNNKDIALQRLAEAISSSSDWEKGSPNLIVSRSTPNPRIAIFGQFEKNFIDSLPIKASWLNKTCAQIKYVGYTQVERDVEILAKKLVNLFGRDQLLDFSFTGIPRGGLIVLGMLSLILGIQPNQLQKPFAEENPIVVVDDCALTGARFGQIIKQHCFDKRNVIFAHLYSHKDLRKNIEEDVLACISSHDLSDFLENNNDKERIKRRLSNQKDSRYWIGQTEHICFPWNEPDRIVWNPVTNEFEKGWNLIPPDLCIKNRCLETKKKIPIQIQPLGIGPLCPSEDVVFGEIDGSIIVGKIKTGKVIQLSNVAADVWNLMIEYGQQELILQKLIQIYDIDRKTLQNDITSLLQEFSSMELIELL